MKQDKAWDGVGRLLRTAARELDSADNALDRLLAEIEAELEALKAERERMVQ